MKESLLDVSNLNLFYSTKKGVVKAVDKVSFSLPHGKTLALVGESGCGKTSLARALIRLLPRNIDRYEGKIILEGQDTMKFNEKRYREEIRWKQISMVFQGALNSLNPVIRIGHQIAEPLIIHEKMEKDQSLKKAEESLKLVGIPTSFADRYPFELSGGMKQRTVIAIALITNPKLIILDEPTSALDVITQANILNLLKDMKRKLSLTFVYITHDIAVSSELADKVAVMYGGEIVELADAAVFFQEPAHPYSQQLMASVPALVKDKDLSFIPGSPPSLIEPPEGCRFHPRCIYKMKKCMTETPVEYELGESCYVRCWLYE